MQSDRGNLVVEANFTHTHVPDYKSENLHLTRADVHVLHHLLLKTRNI